MTQASNQARQTLARPRAPHERRLVLLSAAAVLVAGLTWQNGQAQGSKGDAREQRCYLTEQKVEGKNRQCVYRCDDGSAEGANTGREFTCPNVLFKPVKR